MGIIATQNDKSEKLRSDYPALTRSSRSIFTKPAKRPARCTVEQFTLGWMQIRVITFPAEPEITQPTTKRPRWWGSLNIRQIANPEAFSRRPNLEVIQVEGIAPLRRQQVGDPEVMRQRRPSNIWFVGSIDGKVALRNLEPCMLETLYIVLSASGFVVVFSLIWMGVLILLSRMGGWHGLAREFPATGRIQDANSKMHRWCSARLGLFANYNNCLTLIVSDNGLYMRTNIFLRFAHRPLLIPRPAIVDFSAGSSIIFSSTKITLNRKNDVAPTVITLYGRGLSNTLATWLNEGQEHQEDAAD